MSILPASCLCPCSSPVLSRGFVFRSCVRCVSVRPFAILLPNPPFPSRTSSLYVCVHLLVSHPSSLVLACAHPVYPPLDIVHPSCPAHLVYMSASWCSHLPPSPSFSPDAYAFVFQAGGSTAVRTAPLLRSWSGSQLSAIAFRSVVEPCKKSPIVSIRSLQIKKDASKEKWVCVKCQGIKIVVCLWFVVWR